MALLDSEAGKRRLLSVEIPVVERYNEARDPAYKIRMVRLGGTLVLRYNLKPGHNVYQLETRLVSSYPTVPPETVVHVQRREDGSRVRSFYVPNPLPMTEPVDRHTSQGGEIPGGGNGPSGSGG